MQVSGKQDTYYLYIKEDLSKFHYFSQEVIVSQKEKKKQQQIK